eukprot:PhF_6_TR3029/c0_g1_i1/m.4512
MCRNTISIFHNFSFSRQWFMQQCNRETLLVFTIFGITGSTTVAVVRPCLHTIVQGTPMLASRIPEDASLYKGPNSYRVLYVTVMSPMYTALLVTVGTIFGRGPQFQKFAFKMWARFLPQSVRQRWQPK